MEAISRRCTEDDQDGLTSVRQASHEQHQRSVVVVQSFVDDVAAVWRRTVVALGRAARVHRQNTAVLHLPIRSTPLRFFVSFPVVCLVMVRHFYVGSLDFRSNFYATCIVNLRLTNLQKQNRPRRLLFTILGQLWGKGLGGGSRPFSAD